MSTKGLATALVAMLSGATACASTPANARDADVAADRSGGAEPVPGTSEAYGVSGYQVDVDECAARTCSTSSECCSGDTCGYDPELSRVQRYCLRE